MSHILTRIPVVQRTKSRAICFDPEDHVPTLHWSPEFSIFCNGEGDQRHLWGMEDRALAEKLCSVTGVRFVDCSTNPLLPP